MVEKIFNVSLKIYRISPEFLMFRITSCDCEHWKLLTKLFFSQSDLFSFTDYFFISSSVKALKASVESTRLCISTPTQSFLNKCLCSFPSFSNHLWINCLERTFFLLMSTLLLRFFSDLYSIQIYWTDSVTIYRYAKQLLGKWEKQIKGRKRRTNILLLVECSVCVLITHRFQFRRFSN